MWFSRSLVITAICLFSSSACQKAKDKAGETTPFGSYASLKEGLDQSVIPYLSSQGKENTAPAILIGVTKNGQHQFFPYGTIEVGKNQPPTQDSIWEIGSNTKLFTSLLLAIAANRSGNPEAFLKTPVINILPDLEQKLNASNSSSAAEIKKITLEQLGTHTSGLPSEVPPNLMPRESNDYDLFFRLLSSAPLTSAPGKEYHYSNPGMSLLGKAMSDHLRASYASLVKTLLTQPMGMTQTRFGSSTKYVQGYRIENNKLIASDPVNAGLVNQPTGGLLSSGEDMLRFIDNLMSPPSGQLGDAIKLIKIIRTHYACFDTQCGMGLALGSLDDFRVKTGQTLGFQSVVAFTEGKAGVIILINQREIKDLQVLARKVMAVANQYTE